MILLDTNIISEMMKPAPDPKVVRWLDQQETTELFISTITIGEIAYGLTSLEKFFYHVIREAFEYRILSFDEVAAHLYGIVMAQRRQKGKPLSMADGQIAAIARAHNCALATRNIKDFTGCELELLNPF
jgi:hypothetical protein